MPVIGVDGIFAHFGAVTNILPPHLHDWEHSITPGELRRLLAQHGLVTQALLGLNLATSPLTVFRLLCRFKRGTISYQELGEAMRFHMGGSTLISYIGYALKQ